MVSIESGKLVAEMAPPHMAKTQLDTVHCITHWLSLYSGTGAYMHCTCNCHHLKMVSIECGDSPLEIWSLIGQFHIQGPRWTTIIALQCMYVDCGEGGWQCKEVGHKCSLKRMWGKIPHGQMPQVIWWKMQALSTD